MLRQFGQHGSPSTTNTATNAATTAPTGSAAQGQSRVGTPQKPPRMRQLEAKRDSEVLDQFDDMDDRHEYERIAASSSPCAERPVALDEHPAPAASDNKRSGARPRRSASFGFRSPAGDDAFDAATGVAPKSAGVAPLELTGGAARAKSGLARLFEKLSKSAPGKRAEKRDRPHAGEPNQARVQESDADVSLSGEIDSWDDNADKPASSQRPAHRPRHADALPDGSHQSFGDVEPVVPEPPSSPARTMRTGTAAQALEAAGMADKLACSPVDLLALLRNSPYIELEKPYRILARHLHTIKPTTIAAPEEMIRTLASSIREEGGRSSGVRQLKELRSAAKQICAKLASDSPQHTLASLVLRSTKPH